MIKSKSRIIFKLFQQLPYCYFTLSSKLGDYPEKSACFRLGSTRYDDRMSNFKSKSLYLSGQNNKW